MKKKQPLEEISQFSRRQFLISAGTYTASLGTMFSGFGNIANACESGNKIFNIHPHRNSLIGAVRMDPASSYADVPNLLYQYIQSSETDDLVWESIKEKIDYTYSNLDHCLMPILASHKFKDSKVTLAIKKGVKTNKKLFFKVNLIDPMVLNIVDGQPGPGDKAASDWTILAAVMRFFHDDMGIKYNQMAFGEAGTFMPAYSNLLSLTLDTPCSPEAIMEGRIEKDGVIVGYGGYPGYFVRKYLQENSSVFYETDDDPMGGYTESMAGEYLPPGQAIDKLMVYDLNNAEWNLPNSHENRGRVVAVPGGGINHPRGVVIHKAIAGDPDDIENYPGSVLINISKLKVHCWQIMTNAVKNIGFGGWPMVSGGDNDPDTKDWLYSGPQGQYPPAIKCCNRKGGVSHSVYHCTNPEEGKPPIHDGNTLNKNHGLEGSMVDMCLAIKEVCPVQIHITDAIQTINESHTGDGVKVNEGYVFASKDPVALDLFCARYLFKTVPKSEGRWTGTHLGKGFAVKDPVPYYYDVAEKILSKTEYDSPVSRATTFKYAHKRGLGKLNYSVIGRDTTATKKNILISRKGHFGYLKRNRFKELMTQTRYYHKWGMWWDMQKTMLGYVRASDDLEGSNYYNYLMNEMNGSGLYSGKDDILDTSETGFNGTNDAALSLFGKAYHEVGQNNTNIGMSYFYEKLLKWSDIRWNEFGYNGLKPFKDSMALLNGWKAVDPGTGEWPSFLEMIEIWHEILVGGIWYYASMEGKSFEFYVPIEYDLGPDFEGLVIIEPSEPDFAKKVFTVNYNASSTKFKVAPKMMVASKIMSEMTATDSTRKQMITKIIKTAQPGFGPGFNNEFVSAYTKKRLLAKNL